jgi:hypothetical protein
MEKFNYRKFKNGRMLLILNTIENYIENEELTPIETRFLNVQCLQATIRLMKQFFEFWMSMWTFSSPAVRASLNNLREYFIRILRAPLRGENFGKSLRTIAMDLGKLEAVYRRFPGVGPFYYGKFGTASCYALRAAALNHNGLNRMTTATNLVRFISDVVIEEGLTRRVVHSYHPTEHVLHFLRTPVFARGNFLYPPPDPLLPLLPFFHRIPTMNIIIDDDDEAENFGRVEAALIAQQRESHYIEHPNISGWEGFQ